MYSKSSVGSEDEQRAYLNDVLTPKERVTLDAHSIMESMFAMTSISDQSVDLVVACQSAPGMNEVPDDYRAETEVNIDRAFDEMARVLALNGEARLGPLELRDGVPAMKKVSEKLDMLQLTGKFHTRIESMSETQGRVIIQRIAM